MKKRTYPVMSLLLLWGITTGNAYAQTFEGGDGTSQETAYEIATVEQLNLLRENNKDVYYKLVADIDLSEEENWQPIGNTAVPFEGKIYGNGFKFLNVTIDRPEEDNVGLFGRTMGGIGATVFENIMIEGGSIKGKSLVGALVGRANATITNCHAVDVLVEGEQNVGGLIGEAAANSRITGCSATGNVMATGQNTGGLIGILDSNNEGISHSYAAGEVKGENRVGGLIGYAKNGANYATDEMTIESCYATGDVMGTDTIGGLIGYSAATAVHICAATGNIYGNTAVGGLIGTLRGTAGLGNSPKPVMVSNCYAAGDVAGTGKMVGGFIGEATRIGPGSPFTLTGNFSKGNVTGEDNSAAFTGHSHATGIVSKNVIVATKVVCGPYSKFKLVGYPNAGGTDAEAALNYTENYILENLDFEPQGRPSVDTELLSLDGTQKTEAELKEQSFYEALGWDLSEEGPWQMNTGYGNDDYPILKMIYVENDDPGTGTKLNENDIPSTILTVQGGNLIIDAKTPVLQLTLLGTNGTVITKKAGNGLSILEIPVENLPKGMYILSIQKTETTENIKITF